MFTYGAIFHSKKRPKSGGEETIYNTRSYRKHIFTPYITNGAAYRNKKSSKSTEKGENTDSSLS